MRTENPNPNSQVVGVFFTEESSYTSIMHRDQTDEWRGWMMMVSITIIIIIIITITIIIMSGDPGVSLHRGQCLSPHLHAHQALHLYAPLPPRVRALHLLLAEGADRDNQAGPGTSQTRLEVDMDKPYLNF